MEPIIQEVTREELLALIDDSAQYLLGISGEEFMRRYREGKLEHRSVELPIIVLADLLVHDSTD